MKVGMIGLGVSALFVILLLWLNSLGTAVRYYLPEFDKFDFSPDFSSPEVQPYMDDGIVLGIVVDTYLKPKNNKVSLGAYSQTPGRSVYVRDVELFSRGRSRVRVTLNRDFPIDYKVPGGEEYKTLFSSSPLIEGLTRRYFRFWSGPVEVKLRYVLNGEEKTLIFPMQREVIHYNLTR